VVSRAGRARVHDAVAGPRQVIHVVTGSLISSPPALYVGTVAGLAPERLILQGKGLPAAVLNTIQSARAQSSSSLYVAEWVAFAKWCGSNGVTPSRCEVGDNLQLRYMRQPFRLATRYRTMLKIFSARDTRTGQAHQVKPRWFC